MDGKWKIRISGAAAGLVNGLFGGGGGMVFLPILSRWGGLEQRKLYATCVGVIFPVCLVSAAVYLLRGSVPLAQAAPYLAGGLVGGFIGMGLFALYAELFPDGSNRWFLIPLTFVGVVILIVACQYIWVGGIQPGGVVLCIILFNTPTDTYISYALNRILDTGVGVIAALFVNAMLPGGFTFQFMRRFYAWLGIQSDISHTGPEVPLINRKNKKYAKTSY